MKDNQDLPKYTTNINNPTISLRFSPYGEYYIIYDNQYQAAYFAFASKIDKTWWAKLTEYYNSIQQIWLEYQETPKGKQITNLNFTNF